LLSPVASQQATAFDGYTLISPLMDQRSYLLDMQGRVVHFWKHELPPGNSAYLMPNGNLFRAARLNNHSTFKGGGEGGRIEEYSWQGELLWQFDWNDERGLMHHDFEVLPNGNVLFIAWELIDRETALAAGKDPNLLGPGALWPDAVFEVEPNRPSGGRVVWEWHSWDHIVQDRIPDGPNYAEVWQDPSRIDINGEGEKKELSSEERERLVALGYLSPEQGTCPQVIGGADWMHSNSIDYDAGRDLIALSVRRFNEVWVIDHSTTTEQARGGSGGRYGQGGRLLFRWGNPMAYGRGGLEHRQLFVQHDARFIEAGLPGAGNLLIFNNGQGRAGDRLWSSVDEIDFAEFGPGSNRFDDEGRFLPQQPSWSFGGPELPEFYAGFVSGAQRLANGNTLICEGTEGRVFEVTAQGQIVWNFVSPWGDANVRAPGQRGPQQRRAGQPSIPPVALFRAEKYAADYPAFDGRQLRPLVPQPTVEIPRPNKIRKTSPVF